MKPVDKIKQDDLKWRTKGFLERIENRKLFHYASIDTLQGILENKEIWFANAASMNDKKELLCFIDQLHQSVENTLADHLHMKCRSFFGNILKRLEYEYPFVLCLSLEDDDAAQWERYASNAKGVCIELNTTNFIFACSHPYLWPTIVYYVDGSNEQSNNFALHEFVVKYIRDDNLTGFRNVDGLEDNILIAAAVHKHQSFRNEREIRLMTLLLTDEMRNNIDYKEINGNIREVFKLNLAEQCETNGVNFEDLFDGVIIGPRSSQNIHEMQNWMRWLGYGELAKRVKTSNCPLR